MNLNPKQVTTELPLILEMLLNVSVFTELKGNDIVLKLHDDIINVLANEETSCCFLCLTDAVEFHSEYPSKLNNSIHY